jgi:hypothetical protein
MYKTITGDLPLTFVVVFVVVLFFLSIFARAIRCFTTLQIEDEESKLHRLRQQWLTVMDPAPIDQRRCLALTRWDEVEHLLMIGDKNDTAVETDAVRSASTHRRRHAAPGLRQGV